MIIECPWCGGRSEREFTFGDQAHIIRPANPALVSDEEWTEYLYKRKNPKGIHYERWCHTFGCRQWFNVARHTVDHKVFAVYRMTDKKPQFEGDHE